MPSRYLIYSLLLHLAAAGLLIVSFNLTPAPIVPPPRPAENIVNAVTVDSEQVQKELDRLKQQEESKRRAEQQRQQALKEKAEAAEKKRQAEEKRLAELRQKKKEEERQRQAEQQRLAELKKKQEEAEKKRQAEEEKQRRAEEARKQAEEEKRKAEEARQKAEEERRRMEEEKRKAEAERKRKEAEEAMQKQLAEEQKARDAAQARQDMQVVYQYGERIKRAIRQEFNTTGLPAGLSCVFVIRMIPGGEVVESRIEKSSGNDIFDRRAEIALQKASPLPVPDNPRIFEKMREIRLTFQPQS